MKCKICDSKKISEVIDLGKQPLANKYPKNKKEISKEKNSISKFYFAQDVKLNK